MLVNLSSNTPLANYIRRYVRKERRSINVLIRGPTQYRKSTITLALAKAIDDPKFDINRQMSIIKVTDMMRLLNEKLPKYRVRWFDEIGVGMNHKSWYVWFNRTLNITLQTHGKSMSINLFTVPYSSLVDSDLRKLFDMEVEILSKDEKNRFVIAKIVLLQYNEDLKKVYKHYLRGILPGKRVVPIDRWKIAFPTEEELEPYFLIANKAKDDLHESNLKKTEKQERIEERNVDFDPDKFIPRILRERDKFFSEFQGKDILSEAMIMNEFKVGLHRARQIKTAVKFRLNHPLNLNAPAVENEMRIEL